MENTNQPSREEISQTMSYIDNNHESMPENIYLVLCNTLRNEYNRNNVRRMDNMFHMQSHGNNRVIVSLAETNRILSTVISTQMETIRNNLSTSN